MNLNEKKESLKNFSKIYDLVTLNRNISLIQINRLLKNLNLANEFFLIGKTFLNNPLLKKEIDKIYKNNFLKNEITLWIYPSSNEKYTSNFFDKLENIILSKFKNNDLFIPIGERAIEFANKNNFKTLTTFKNLDNQDEVLDQLSSFIDYGIKNNQFSNILFVIYSNKVSDFIAKVYPLNEFNFQTNSKNTNLEIINKNFNKFKFFPNYEEFISSQIKTYFNNVIHILFLESQFIVFKNKLIHENTLLNEIEERMKKLRTTILKIERELEIEELNLIKPKNRKVI